MTMREWLRAIAGALEDTAADHEQVKGERSVATRQSAAALRALADRMDAEQLRAQTMADSKEESRTGSFDRVAGTHVLSALARLDAAPLAPREPEVKACEPETPDGFDGDPFCDDCLKYRCNVHRSQPGGDRR